MQTKPEGVRSEEDWKRYQTACEGWKNFKRTNLRQHVYAYLWRIGGGPTRFGSGSLFECQVAFREFLKSLELPDDVIREAGSENDKRTHDWHFQAWMLQSQLKAESNALFCCRTHCWETRTLPDCGCPAHRHLE